jgi:hypothetical protein
MKKMLVLLLVKVMVCILIFGSCAQPATAPQPTSEPTPPPAQEPSTVSSPAPEPSPPPTKVVKQVELKYDDGKPNQWATARPPLAYGYLIDFTPPSTPLTIKKVRILGMLVGGTPKPTFDVEILDSEKKVINSTEQPISIFPTGLGNAEWVEIEIPDVQVNGKFYVHVYTATGHNEGIHIGWDDSVPNEHSSVSGVKSGEVVTEAPQWPYGDVRMSDPSKVNWMIRVVGTL